MAPKPRHADWAAWVGPCRVEGDAPPPPSPPRRAVSDSREVAPGDLFVSLAQDAAAAAAHLAQARASGACAGVVGEDVLAPGGAATGWTVLRVPDARVALARAARDLAGRPDEALGVWGVTGTNGKTTTAFLMRALFDAAGLRCGLLGTVWNDTGEGPVASALTTHDADVVFGLLARMRRSGCARAAMEVSSHALVQRRVEGLRFAGAAFTNLTQDHLDFHGTMESYRDAKGLLFEGLAPGAWAVLNAADPASVVFAARTGAQVRTYGAGRPADVTAEVHGMDLGGTDVTFRDGGRAGRVRIGLVGGWNVENALAALAAATAGGVAWETALSALGGAKAPPGRLEPVDAGQPFGVLVDYAHTDAAIDAVLAGIRPLVPGRLIALFGCGGDRDRTKRPRMARAAQRHADLVVLTSDNPRTEDPEGILREAAVGLDASRPSRTIADRAAAISFAVREARPGDCVAILGKGHETYQIVGTRRLPFDDREVARAELRAVAGRRG